MRGARKQVYNPRSAQPSGAVDANASAARRNVYIRGGKSCGLGEGGGGLHMEGNTSWYLICFFPFICKRKKKLSC